MSSTDYTAVDPPLLDWGIDIELTWNAIVDYDMGKIKEDNVKDVPTTTDLLCTPGKYTEAEYKVDSIYKNFGTTWWGSTNFAKEIVGISLNGVMFAQSLTSADADTGLGQDPFYPGNGDAKSISYDTCGLSYEQYCRYD